MASAARKRRKYVYCRPFGERYEIVRDRYTVDQHAADLQNSDKLGTEIFPEPFTQLSDRADRHRHLGHTRGGSGGGEQPYVDRR